MSGLYEADIVAWSQRQAELLRRVAAGERLNDEVDWENVIEQIDSVGRSETDAVESLLYQAVLHRLQAQGWPDSLAVPHWQAETRGALARARRKFRGSMRQKIDVAGLYADALVSVPATMDGLPHQPLPAECPWSLDSLLGEADAA